MSTTINLPISRLFKITVGVGDRITHKTILAKFGEIHEEVTIHLAKLLGVDSRKVSKYLKRKIGEKITAGEVIAEKKGIFSSSFVKSPINGKLAGLDLSKGTLTLIKYFKGAMEDLVSPVAGKVVDIGKSAIEIEVDNPIFKAIKGEGKDVVGDLKYLKGEAVGVLDTQADLEESIILCKFAAEATLVKFSVIGVKGVMMLKIKGEIDLPWVQVEENIFEKLVDLDKRKIWLRPVEKQIVILE